jgi:hypothetical protein
MCFIAAALGGIACASTQPTGQLGEGSTPPPRITAADSAFPPRHVTIEMPQSGYAALLLVAPGHSATLLYPRDSLANNSLSAGSHRLAFEVPSFLVQDDSARLRARDTSRLRTRARVRGGRPIAQPLPPTTPTYFLFVTSPQPLTYSRLIERTRGVTIPNIEMEALNAVAKAVKSTIPNEPREWAGYYQLVELRRSR